MTVNTKEELIDCVYNNLLINYQNESCMSGAILTTKNKDVHYMNNIVMGKLSGDLISLKSIDSVSNDDQAAIHPPEFLNSINISGLPPHELKLKIGAPIMLLRNLDHRNGHCNGAKYEIVTANNNLLTARKVTGVDVGDIVLIPRITLMPSYSVLPFTLQRRRFPIRPCSLCYVHQ